MKNFNSFNSVATISAILMVSACSTQEEMASKPPPKPAPAAPAPSAKAETKAPEEKAAEKAKATKLAGDVGLLDTEKNYMILVTKDGKLVTLDFDPKFQPVEKTPIPRKWLMSALAHLRSCNIPSKATRTSQPMLNIYRPRVSDIRS